ncbi:phenylalanine--tRNA ligase subunit alpha [Desulfurispira natronophila]|uniref:Phenylalanine--tRNA ligase alpha subunit n=1 Tax=Desulfurispira natronophila TaxID=682562 RepID=A0A7W8DH90_9BACT|nr:phenylalanine--tRNA ligase subunit alpha [Desulfurispira natronophila]MBB5022038.1 phenylalanyl-tRNA synthetase alpha chain [Desulfurispira natronophila]
MKEELQLLEREALERIQATTSTRELADIRVHYLGKKGQVAQAMQSMKQIDPAERPAMGKVVNSVKSALSQAIEERQAQLQEQEKQQKLQQEQVDVTLPGILPGPQGALHPISRIMHEIIQIFATLGFTVEEGPEIETDFYNFEALNIPPNHPARDMQDTFYVSDEILLRTHTSPVQVRTMLNQKPPVRIIAPGKVYRCDSDLTHTPMFHQVEGLLIDQSTTFADLKGVLEYFCKAMFGEDKAVRFRPSFFPFTEPSAEVDIECVMCQGSGCRVCKETGWLEILGCGMVDPNVFGAVNYDPEIYQGFAFGMGVERITMLKYGINDLRLFFENDVRFLRQYQ